MFIILGFGCYIGYGCEFEVSLYYIVIFIWIKEKEENEIYVI